ncbi:MAG: hypothetical protein JGK17_07640 [Microcoleus sp. PH2017_10_PVI_O_A]|uniref:hypothetical protein n=1 Tax=unclassified Microcoleus TaxID=2642155 RepID=UPI001D3F771C|nr:MULTISPECIES: hypothetical protein [unclassified Microcoleus]MCC3405455.1 hypothetical protein [Microcoleus sp. PH2017_10_PVI_O_A]MCC3459449.1 hypothetical protein [Microcoleus sp. PH2017_11_PCY_U_A]MCC3477728.1 hypothetical protein [Microcoleus sp. PH2017_12_PCY_D_A]MCC3527450.1 hypothetical protein [Microcoleus sp. PH2017_21_RUC_O_A]MCC3539534.1 hypothetical protein [Microcoleus sp. PH2017_22_RUC_O_B]
MQVIEFAAIDAEGLESLVESGFGDRADGNLEVGKGIKKSWVSLMIEVSLCDN